jgi:hypothetical protein
MTFRTHLCAAVFAATTPLVAVHAQDESATRILERIQTLRPSDAELGLFRLDWADSVEDAVRRAAREGKPVVCVVNHAEYGDLKNGHC